MSEGVAIVLKNELTDAFRLHRALFVLDGVLLYDERRDAEYCMPGAEVLVFRGPLGSGEHVVQIHLGMRGDGDGALAYRRGYRFELKSSHTFKVKEGRPLLLQMVLHEGRGPSAESHYFPRRATPSLGSPAAAPPHSGAGEPDRSPTVSAPPSAAVIGFKNEIRRHGSSAF